MIASKRLWYNLMVGVLRLYRDLVLDLHVWGREHIPPGAKIYVTNHITSTDPNWVLPVFTEPVHIIIGPGYQSRIMTYFLEYIEQINAMPARRKNVVDEAVKYLRKGEPVYTAPEGDLQEPFTLGHFFPGVARIYRKCRAPIIPIALVAPKRAMKQWPFTIVVEGRVYRTIVVLRGPFCINVGEPFCPAVTDDGGPEEDERIMGELKDRIRQLVDDVRFNKYWL